MSRPRHAPSPELEECVRRHVRLSFARSGGRGGQNVNKVSTKVLARVALGALEVLTQIERERVREKLAARISERGELQVFADEERTQARNRELAIRRLAELVAQASYRPRPRVKTRPSRRAREERLTSKKRRGERKSERRRPIPD